LTSTLPGPGPGPGPGPPPPPPPPPVRRIFNPPLSSSSYSSSSLIAVALISSHIAVRCLIIKCSNRNNPLQMCKFLANVCNFERLVRGAGFGNCVKTGLYCSSHHLICMHWVQIKLQRSILPKVTIPGTSKNILPYIAEYCQIYCYQRQVKDCTKSSENRLPFSCSYLSRIAKSTCAIIPFCAKVALRQPMLCPLFAPLFLSASNLFHIIFTGSFYVSLYIIFTMKK